ncbi:MAG: hypothetical protein HYX82_04000 [Chloroflexi bacterium]|nr:hypothetical protein [Chloroflexota bacterium]
MRLVTFGNLWAIMAVFLALLLTPSNALAHERRDVGKYQFVVGFIMEPAFEGQKNGVELRVTNTETQQPVEGLERTLQVEVTHVPSGVSRVFKLRAIFRDPGHYTTDLLLTSPGHYRLRFFGTIEGREVNETFESRSGGGQFNDVESSTDIQFPQALAEAREIEAAVRGSQNTAQQAQGVALDAKDKASSASTLAMVGIALGAIGIALAAGSIVVTLRRR